ncbi:MAG TPA: glycosyltransferase [Actinomycetota bacterium]|nr:glycosyltransferase [Actinomycetota bacterium]
MIVAVVSDDRVCVTPDGRAHTIAGYDWHRVAELFGPDLRELRLYSRVFYAERPPESWGPLGTGDKVRIVPLPWFHKYQALVRIPGAARQLRRELRGADVVWLIVPNVYSTIAYFAARTRRRPIVAWCVGDAEETATMVYDEWPLRISHRAYGRVTRRIVRRADVPVVTSRALARKYGVEGRALVAYRSFRDPGYLAEEPAGGREDADVVLYLGRLSPEKGVATLVAAFERVLERVPEARLVVAGDGPERPALADEVERRGMTASVEFAGWIAHGTPMSELLHGATVLCLPSYSEGMPAVLLEGLWASLPAVVTSAGDMAAAAGDAAIVVPPRDEAALADALVRVLTDPVLRRRLAGAAGTAAEASSFEKQTGAVVAATRDLVARRRGKRGG